MISINTVHELSPFADCDFDVCKNVLSNILRLRETSGGQLNANRLPQSDARRKEKVGALYSSVSGIPSISLCTPQNSIALAVV